MRRVGQSEGVGGTPPWSGLRGPTHVRAQVWTKQVAVVAVSAKSGPNAVGALPRTATYDSTTKRRKSWRLPGDLRCYVQQVLDSS